MSKQIPMLMESPISKHVYIVTKYMDEGNYFFMAREKHDITEQFDALAMKRCRKLTAEQVRASIESRFEVDVYVPNERWQAIADELNAKLGTSV